ncbi:MAG: cadherin-like beta sandwich domain-containing protein, partial [Firmicutes bacterium]|nr:cadherin-like beta sandwich domain-containing protein [Bacillota bacterium]
MKRIFTIILVIGLVFGLAAPAWAADGISNVEIKCNGAVVGTSIVGYNQEVTISGNIPLNETYAGSGDGQSVTYHLSNDANASISDVSTGGIRIFSLTVSGSKIASLNGKVELTLTKDYTTYVDGEETESATGFPVATYTTPNISIAHEAKMTASNIKLSCPDNHTFSVTGSGTTFSCTIPLACANANHTITISTQNLETGLTPTIGNSTVPSNTGSFSTSIKITNEAAESTTYTLSLSAPSADLTMKSVTLTSNSSTVGSNTTATPSTNSSSPTIINVTSTTSGSISISVNAEANAQGATATPSSASFSLAEGASQAFSVLVTAPNGATQTYYYRATRSTAAVTLLNSITLSSSLGSITNVMSDALSRTLTINTSLENATFTIVPGPGCTIMRFRLKTSSSWTIVKEQIVDVSKSFGPTTMPTTGNSREYEIEVKAPNGDLIIITLTVTNTTGTSLATSVYIRNSSTYGSGSTATSPSSVAIYSNSGTQTMTVSSSYTSSTLYAHIALASGVTLSSATFDGSNLSLSGTATERVLQLSSSLSGDLVLRFSSGDSRTINIDRGSSSSNRLSNLRISNTTNSNTSNLYDLNPSFSSGTKSYTVYVDSGTTYIYIFPTKNSNSDTLTVTGTTGMTVTDYFSSSGYYRITLGTSSSKTVYIAVNNSSGSDRYSISIDQGANVNRNASLNTLSVRNGSSSGSSTYTLSPSFLYNRLNYDVSLSNSVTEAYIHFTLYTSSASVSVSNASLVSTGVYRATLSGGQPKTVTISVTYSGTTTRYYINLGGSTKARLNSLRVASQDNTSSSYQYTLAPSFSSSITNYTVLIPYTNSSSRPVWIMATLNNSNDDLRVDGSVSSSGSWVNVSSVSPGNHSNVEIRVDDSDGNRNTYKLDIIAAPSNASNDANLNTLSLTRGNSSSNNISFNTSFNSNTTSYTADSVANDVDSVRVYASGYRASAIVVNNELMDDSYITVGLNTGSNTIRVTVYAENCETSKTYTISINRGASGSADCSLAGLEVRTSTQTLNLIPAFVKTTFTYTINVSDDITQLSFRPTASDSGATIRMQGISLTSGQWSGYNSLYSGTTSFVFTVTAADGSTTSSYTVSVVRGLNP